MEIYKTFDMGQVAMGKIFLDWTDRNYNRNSRKMHRRLAWFDGWERYERIACEYVRDEMSYKCIRPDPENGVFPDIFLTRWNIAFRECPLDYLKVNSRQIRKDGFVAISVPAPEYYGQRDHILPFSFWYNSLIRYQMDVLDYLRVSDDHNTFVREYNIKRKTAPKEVEYWFFAKRRTKNVTKAQ